jgi:putative transposase
MQRLIEADAAKQIGAGPHERASTRTMYRNGYRERILDTGRDAWNCRPPSCARAVSSRPCSSRDDASIESCWRWSRRPTCSASAPRKVDDLMAGLGGCSISCSEVGRICALLDEELAEFRERPLDELYP